MARVLVSIVLLACIVGNVVPILGQTLLIETRRITPQQGLASSRVLSIMQDNEGFLWFATDKGLQRFDGAKFLTYRSRSQQSELPSDYVTAIAQDSTGRIWAGTNKGLCSIGLYDTPQTNGISTTTQNKQQASPTVKLPTIAELGDSLITTLYCDNSGRMWIGSYNGNALAYNPTSRSTIARHHDVNSIQRFHEDPNGNIWAQTAGATVLAFPRKISKGNVQLFTLPNGYSDGELFTVDSTLCVKCMPKITVRTASSTPSLWTAHYGKGLQQSTARTPFKALLERYSTDEVSLRVESSDELGAIWVSVVGYDAMQSLTGLYYVPANSEQLPDKPVISGKITSFCRDRAGIVWAGVENVGVTSVVVSGMHYYDMSNVANLDFDAANTPLTSLYKDQQGKLWVGLSNGLVRFDVQTGSWKRYVLANGASSSSNTKPTTVYSIAEDANERLLIGTNKGVFLYNRSSDSFSPETTMSAVLEGASVSVIARDRSTSDVWMYAFPYGLCRFNKQGQLLSRYDSKPAPEGITAEPVQSLWCDNRGTVWVGTFNGVSSWDPASQKFQHYPTGGASVASLAEDATNNVVAALDNDGLTIYNKVNSKIRRVTQENSGIPSNAIVSVRADGRNRYWLLFANNTLGKYYPETGRYATVLPASEPSHSTGVSFQESNGTMYFSSAKGFVMFAPDKLGTSRLRLDPPRLTIVSAARNEAVAENTPRNGDTITIEYNETLRLEVAALDFVAPERNLYSFFLSGHDTTWSNASASRTMRYANLPPGEYELQVRGCGADQIWNESGIAITVIVHGPFWRTWWFISIVTIIVLATGGALVEYRRQRVRERRFIAINRERTRLAQQRAEREKERAEYALALHERDKERTLRETAQHEREKEEIDRLIISFQLRTMQLQMNPHFLYNALMQLQGLIQLQHTKEANEYVVTFKELLRNVIEQSMNPLSALEHEINFLRAYIELEQYYTEEPFEYEIEAPTEFAHLDSLQNIFIPPMILQPYVENAIRHGLQPLHEFEFNRRGKLRISFRYTERNVFCTIEDNGIGRELSRKRQLGSSLKDHLSFSTGLISDHMNLISVLHEVSVTADYTDLVADDGTPLGTRVFIHLPLFPKPSIVASSTLDLERFLHQRARAKQQTARQQNPKPKNPPSSSQSSSQGLSQDNAATNPLHFSASQDPLSNVVFSNSHKFADN